MHCAPGARRAERGLGGRVSRSLAAGACSALHGSWCRVHGLEGWFHVDADIRSYAVFGLWLTFRVWSSVICWRMLGPQLLVCGVEVLSVLRHATLGIRVKVL